MTLFIATLLTALVLLGKGVALLINPPELEAKLKALPRSEVVSYITLGIGGAWFLWKIAHLPEADFGDYSNWLLMLFGAVIVGSFLWVKDFLAIRGAAILMLLISNEWLKLAFAQYELPQRLLLVSFVYVCIILAIFVGTVPFRVRDFLNWLFAANSRVRIVGISMVVYGLVLLVAAFTY
jgi:hypothetical protein